MNAILQYKEMKASGKNIWTGIALVAGFAMYIALGAEKQPSSPLALLVMAAVGWLISLKWNLPGNIILFFSGATLLVHPFLFYSSALYVIPAVPFCTAAVIAFVNWWKSDENE